MIIAGLIILLVAAVMFFPLIKKKPKNEISKPEQDCNKENIHEPPDSGAQVIINIKNYHEAKNEIPHIRCEYCGNKNKLNSSKCQDCGAP